MSAAVYLKVLGTTLLVIGIFLVLFYFLRRGRVGFVSGGGEIEVREIRSLDFKNRLALIRVRGRILLLGISERGISLLREWSDEA